MNDMLRWFIPPVVFLAVSKMVDLLRLRKLVPGHSPEAPESLRWCPIRSGPLTGRSLFMNPKAQAYQATMLEGTFDQFLFDYIDCTNWSGKVIYDIGAHVGYHTLNFAHRVGLSGRVFSFEPHPLHLERMKVNLSGNADLAAHVTLLPVALSSVSGQQDFFCTESVEGGGSSASFIEGTSRPLLSSYRMHYQTIKVETARLDDLVAAGRWPPPDLVKIDVEGAESLVVEGALETLEKNKPRIVIEVHSIPNMMRLALLLLPLGYSFKVLEEQDQRSFVAAEPQDQECQ